MNTGTTMTSAVLPRAPVHRLNELSDDRAKTLHSLLVQNHAAHAVLREPRLLFHNHVPHALGSSYLLGSSSTKLREIYETEVPNLSPVDSGVPRNEITFQTWRKYLGQKRYTAAYVDYFDSEVEKHGGDWEQVLNKHLYCGPDMLLNGLSGGLGHPFIHLAYGYEFECKEVITEALSLACTEYDAAHKYLDSPKSDSSTYKTRQLSEVISRIQMDTRFNNYSEHPGFANIRTLWATHESEVLEHWNALIVDNVVVQLQDWMHTAVLLAISTADTTSNYDFYLAHVLTVGHALRILLPRIPEQHWVGIMKQYGLFVIVVYLAQLRPTCEEECILAVKAGCTSWDDIYSRALGSKWYKDLHWPKVVRALKEVELLRGVRNNFYRSAAEKFISEFNGWTGFGLGVDAIE